MEMWPSTRGFVCRLANGWSRRRACSWSPATTTCPPRPSPTCCTCPWRLGLSSSSPKCGPAWQLWRAPAVANAKCPLSSWCRPLSPSPCSPCAWTTQCKFDLSAARAHEWARWSTLGSCLSLCRCARGSEWRRRPFCRCRSWLWPKCHDQLERSECWPFYLFIWLV